MVPFGMLARVGSKVVNNSYRKQQESSPASLESNMSGLSIIRLWRVGGRKIVKGVFAEGRESNRWMQDVRIFSNERTPELCWQWATCDLLSG